MIVGSHCCSGWRSGSVTPSLTSPVLILVFSHGNLLFISFISETIQEWIDTEAKAAMTDSNTTAMPTPKTYEGNCHCGLVKYTVTLPEALAPEGAGQIGRCNCSICTKNGTSLSKPSNPRPL